MKQTFWSGILPFTVCLYYTVLLHFVLNLAIVAKFLYFAWICSYYDSILLFAFAFLFSLAKSTQAYTDQLPVTTCDMGNRIVLHSLCHDEEIGTH